MALRNVLVADDEESMRHLLSVILRDHGYEARAVSNGEEALKELAARPYDLLLSDVRMPRLGGLELLAQVIPLYPELTVIMMSAYGAVDSAIEAMKHGAYDYISKPFKPDEVLLVIKKAEERERLARENRRLRTELASEYRAENIVGDSAPMQAVLKQVRKIAPLKTTVLLTGETGTGKELLARAIHELSPRASLPFVGVNCGAIPSELMESELFGHVKGAFTDASRNKKGLVSEAEGGTLAAVAPADRRAAPIPLFHVSRNIDGGSCPTVDSGKPVLPQCPGPHGRRGHPPSGRMGTLQCHGGPDPGRLRPPGRRAYPPDPWPRRRGHPGRDPPGRLGRAPDTLSLIHI